MSKKNVKQTGEAFRGPDELCDRSTDEYAVGIQFVLLLIS